MNRNPSTSDAKDARRLLLTIGLGIGVSIATAACGSAVPQLITPEQAQDRVYDHLSRAEAFRMSNNPKLAAIERTKARTYKEMIRNGETTTREQAVAAAAAHRRRAAVLRARGYTRFVKRELVTARRYEKFAEGVAEKSGIPAMNRPGSNRSGYSAPTSAP